MAVPRIKTFSNGGTLIPSDLNSIQDDYGARFDAAYVAAGLSADSIVRRGKSIVATTETMAGAGIGTFAYMPTPDRVQNLVVPTDGLVGIITEGQAKTDVTTNPSGAIQISIGSNILTTVSFADTLAPGNYQAWGTTGPGTALLTGIGTGSTASDVPLPTVAQFLPVWVRLTAGTYDVGLKFAAIAGATLSAQNRHLWVWTQGS